MIKIVLEGVHDAGKTTCLNVVANLLQGKPAFDGDVSRNGRYTIPYKGQLIAVCTWGDNKGEIDKNIDFANQKPYDAVIMACRKKGKPANTVTGWSDEVVFKKCVKKERWDFVSEAEFLNGIKDKALREAMLIIDLLEKLL